MRYYKELLSNLNVNRNKGRIAPHKAILLLTVIDMIESGDLSNSFILLSELLESRYKQIWKTYVPKNTGFSCRLHYPFFHLASSPFWKLEKSSTYEDKTEYSSIAALRRSFVGAKIDDDFFNLLSDPSFRTEIKQLLINEYLTFDNDKPSTITPHIFIALTALFIA